MRYVHHLGLLGIVVMVKVKGALEWELIKLVGIQTTHVAGRMNGIIGLQVQYRVDNRPCIGHIIPGVVIVMYVVLEPFWLIVGVQPRVAKYLRLLFYGE